ncbi:MAG: response regulator transcription factor [Dehalococcoidales bacterium]|nr:response regulator transcription factor [Dehalococcoidales bacterium]
METIRTVLGDDHTLVREGTRRILEQHADLSVVGEAGDGQAALELVKRLRPDVLILDIRMPKLSGVEVVRSMKQDGLDTRVLVLTAYDDDDYILALMEAGASGYMLKTARAGELVDAVRRIHEGEPVLHPSIAVKVARLWNRRQVSVHQDAPGQLSPREREVLELAGKGLRNKMIAGKLGISMRTVEGHFNSILAKLGVSSRLEAVLYAVSHGWIALEESKDQS